MTMSSSSSAHSLSRHHSREYASFVHSNLTSSSSSSTSILPTHASSPSPVADSWYLGDPAVPPLQAGAPGIANPADAVQAYRAARLSSAESLSSTKAGNPTVTLKITVCKSLTSPTYLHSHGLSPVLPSLSIPFCCTGDRLPDDS